MKPALNLAAFCDIHLWWLPVHFAQGDVDAAEIGDHVGYFVANGHRGQAVLGGED